MRSRPLLHAVALAALAAGCGRQAVVQVGPGDDLAAVLADAPDRATLRLGEGRYRLNGAGVRGKSFNITGAGMDSTFIETAADGGMRFADSLYSALQDLTVTAVTVERGQLTLVAVRVDGRGVAVSGGAGSRLVIRDSEVTGDHAVGVLLGDGSVGTVETSLIEGGVSGGGVGLDILPRARVSVLNTVIRRHDRALSISTDASVEIHGNLVEGAQRSGLEGEGALWRIDDNVVWTPGAAPDETTRRRVCGNLPALRYGRSSAFFGVFCEGLPKPD